MYSSLNENILYSICKIFAFIYFQNKIDTQQKRQKLTAFSMFIEKQQIRKFCWDGAELSRDSQSWRLCNHDWPLLQLSVARDLYWFVGSSWCLLLQVGVFLSNVYIDRNDLLCIRCMYVCIYLCLHGYVFIALHQLVYVCMSMCMYVYDYVYMNFCKIDITFNLGVNRLISTWQTF